jgi:type IV secretory pathway TrbD component
MNNATPRIRSVAVIGPRILSVRWKGGGGDRINLSGWIATGGGILSALLQPAEFGQPRVADYGTAVAWGEDDDLRIDAVHLEQIAAEQRPFGASDAAKWQKTMALSNNEAADLLGISASTWLVYKAGARMPSAIAMLCRAARRDPILMHAHYRPRKTGRPARKSA